MVDGNAAVKIALIILVIISFILFRICYDCEYNNYSDSNNTQLYRNTDRRNEDEDENDRLFFEELRRRHNISLEIPEFRPRPGQRSNQEILQQNLPQNTSTAPHSPVTIQIQPSAPPTIGWINELNDSNDLPSYGQAINQISRSHTNLANIGQQPSSQFALSRSTNHLHTPSAPPSSDISQENDDVCPSYGEAMAFLNAKGK